MVNDRLPTTWTRDREVFEDLMIAALDSIGRLPWWRVRRRWLMRAVGRYMLEIIAEGDRRAGR